jgi:integrase
MKGGKRNVALFVMGINTALRIGDLLTLRVGEVLDSEGKVLKTITMTEQKTGKRKRFPVNESIKHVLSEYLAEREAFSREEPLFLSRKGEALSRSQAWRIMKRAGKSVGLGHIGTHSLRKTFGYHLYKKTGGDIGLVQKLLNHSSTGLTLRYIGIDREKMDNAYLELNL